MSGLTFLRICCLYLMKQLQFEVKNCFAFIHNHRSCSSSLAIIRTQ